MKQNVFNNISIDDELPFISVKELCDEEVRFKVKDIFIKNNVVTKFCPEGQTVAYVKLHIGDTDFMSSIKQTVLLKKFKQLKEEREAGTCPYGPETLFIIDYPAEKNYYDLFYDDGQ